MTFTNINILINKSLKNKNLKIKVDAAKICHLFNDYILRNFPNFHSKARFFKDNTIFFESESHIEANEIILKSREIILYLKEKLGNVNEIKLKIVSQRP